MNKEHWNPFKPVDNDIDVTASIVVTIEWTLLLVWYMRGFYITYSRIASNSAEANIFENQLFVLDGYLNIH